MRLAVAIALAAAAGRRVARGRGDLHAERGDARRTIRTGAGREQTFYACIACHGFKIVAQQGQTRQQWDDTLNWMTKRHGMPPIDGELRKIVLDYLETTFPPRTAPGGWQNPFSGQ